ncbi:MAG: cysteine-rich CWC family protein [Proteobacteria bacterium]|nr:cysteine-rich CWC family protein [Pseudomonadota bacterium]
MISDPRSSSVRDNGACPRCKAVFECGAKAGSARCWCFDLPAVTPTSTECLCPACLAAEATAQAPDRSSIA